MKNLIIYYEGDTDKRFIEKVLIEPLSKKYCRVETICIGSMTGDKLKESINKLRMRGNEYIYFADKDDCNCLIKKRDIVLNTIGQNSEDHCVVIVCYELESWIYAGLGKCGCNKLGLEYFDSTELMTKEEFYNIGKNIGISSKIIFMKKTLNIFEMKYALKCNESFAYFVKKYIPDFKH